MWDASDDALLAGLGAGDRTASAVFVRRYQRRVHGLALSIVGDQGRAAEVAQDAFVRAWRHASSFDPRRGSVAAWLLAITRNLAVDRLRMEGARPADPIDPSTLLRSVPEAAGDQGPEEAAVTGIETARVVRALADLPEAQRRSVLLATVGGRTAREVGEIEDIPLGTAKTRIRDGLRRVRALLDEEAAPRD